MSNPNKKIAFQNMADVKMTFGSLAKNSRNKSLALLNSDSTQRICQETEFDPLKWEFSIKNGSTKESQTQEKAMELEEQEELEIVDNSNKKIKIKVSGLTGKTTQKSFEGVPNPIDFKERQQSFDAMKFNTDFKSGYAPIEIQQTQEKDFAKVKDPEKKETIQHFIRKKQSCASINLKRTCGVSYVKKSESQQLNVRNIFDPLPPLIFQCSSECDEVTDISLYHSIFSRLFKQKPLLLVCLEAEDEIIRDYLLKPEKREELSKGRILVVKDYKEIWPLFFDKLFLVVHFFYKEKELISGVDHLNSLDFKSMSELLPKSQFQLGILLKKNLSGKKSFIKTLGEDFNLFLENQEENPEILDFDSKANIVSSLDDKKPVIIDPKLLSSENTNGNDSNGNTKNGEKAKNKPKFLSSIMNKLTNFCSKPKEEVNLDTSSSVINTNSVSTAFSSPAKGSNLIMGVHPSVLNYLQKDPKTKNINTISVRMELYIEEALWKRLGEQEKNQLNGLILNIDDTFQREALSMTNSRFEAFESSFPTQFFSSLQKITLFSSENPRPLSLEDIFPSTKSSQTSESKKIKELSSFGLPLYYISTRDCFAFDLIEKNTILQLPGRPNVRKTEYFFHPKGKPQNFKAFEGEFPDLRVGVTCYNNFFTHEELLDLESKTFETEIKCFKKHFLPMTAQATFTSEKVRRTKFFFGVRYMWSKQQIAEPYSNIAAGVRADVSPPPDWLKKDIEGSLVKAGIIPKDFVNSITMNVYHDGKEGLAQHFDDAVRFKQPIFTLRLFSDCRLSFGSQFYGFCNGAFCVPLPRGCIAVLEENSYAANGVKHCVRPCDMTGKSAAIILRQMHEKCLSDAQKLADFVDFPACFSTLTINEKAVSYDEQKRIEADMNIGGGCARSLNT